MFTKKLLSMVCACWVGFGLGMMDSWLETKPIVTITVSVSKIDGTTKKIELTRQMQCCNSDNLSHLINSCNFDDFIKRCYESFAIDRNDSKIQILSDKEPITAENYHELTDGAELNLVQMGINEPETIRLPPMEIVLSTPELQAGLHKGLPYKI